MIPSRKTVAKLCDKLMEVKPAQIVIDLVQEKIEELVHADEVTPDDIGALAYECGLLLDVYSSKLMGDIYYLQQLKDALNDWEKDATFANKALGLMIYSLTLPK